MGCWLEELVHIKVEYARKAIAFIDPTLNLVDTL